MENGSLSHSLPLGRAVGDHAYYELTIVSKDAEGRALRGVARHTFSAGTVQVGAHPWYPAAAGSLIHFSMALIDRNVPPPPPAPGAESDSGGGSGSVEEEDAFAGLFPRV